MRDAESEYLDLAQDEENAVGAIVVASTEASDRTYRLVFGPNAGDFSPYIRPMTKIRYLSPSGYRNER